MLEALYGAEFSSNLGDMGYGVAVVETGRILGGDSSFVFVGSYEVENGIIKADVKCTNDRGVMESIFGDIKEYTVRVQGAPADDEFTLNGHVVENPAMLVEVKLTRRAELP